MDVGFWQTTCAILIPGMLFASWIDYSQKRVPNWLNLALIVGAYEGLGYGESIGSFIEREELTIPDRGELEKMVRTSSGEDWDKVAAAADLLQTVQTFDLESGSLTVDHPYKEYSIQARGSARALPAVPGATGTYPAPKQVEMARARPRSMG